MAKKKKGKGKTVNISIHRSLAEDILRFIDEHEELHLKRSVSAFVNEAARNRLLNLKSRRARDEDTL